MNDPVICETDENRCNEDRDERKMPYCKSDHPLGSIHEFRLERSSFCDQCVNSWSGVASKQSKEYETETPYLGCFEKHRKSERSSRKGFSPYVSKERSAGNEG